MTAVLVIYAVMSTVAFAAYWIDKQRAIRGQWRVREATLHGIEFFGGWPGALVAQRVLHHKRSKTPYLVVFWTIGVIHALAWIWWVVSA